MDPFEEIKYLGIHTAEVEDFDYAPSHSLLSDRLRKTLYLAQDRMDGMSLPVADAAVDIFQSVSGSPLRKISPRHVANLSKRSRVAPCTLLLAMMYARRLQTKNQAFPKKVNSADLLLVSMMVASKFLYDEGEDEEMFSDEWAQAANVDVKHVYELEMEFLAAMDWDLFVHADEFFDFIRLLETRIAYKEGINRGWFSYSDLEVLMSQQNWWNMWTTMALQSFKVIGWCIAIYAVCATTIIWAALVIQHVQLVSPTQTCHLPSVLNSHLKKSTLIHLYPGEDALGVAKSPDALCFPSIHSENSVSEAHQNGFDQDTKDENTTDCHLLNENDFRCNISARIHHKYLAAKGALMVFCQALIAAWDEYYTEVRGHSGDHIHCSQCRVSEEVDRIPCGSDAPCCSTPSVNQGRDIPTKCTCGMWNGWKSCSGQSYGEEILPRTTVFSSKLVSIGLADRCTWSQSPNFPGGGGFPNQNIIHRLLWTFADLQVGFATSSHISFSSHY